MRSLAVLLLALFVAVPEALPWGAQGHAAIGILASQRLTPKAREHVVQLLGNDDLGAIASWMDQALNVPKNFGPLAADPEAHAFVKANPKSFFWHFVDIPMDAPGYDDHSPFARPDDVVHQINIAIDVLEGRSTAVPKRIALFMLVHLVGDLHQPLHVSCGFYDLADPAHPKLVTSPADALGKPSDEGGNALKYGDGKYDQLHGLWDIKLPELLVGGTQDVPPLVGKLNPIVESKAWSTPGDYHRWAEAWATESLQAARQVYGGIRFGASTLDQGKLKAIRIQLPADYNETEMPLAEKRMAQAGFHLAELLNSIQWQ